VNCCVRCGSRWLKMWLMSCIFNILILYFIWINCKCIFYSIKRKPLLILNKFEVMIYFIIKFNSKTQILECRRHHGRQYCCSYGHRCLEYHSFLVTTVFKLFYKHKFVSRGISRLICVETQLHRISLLDSRLIFLIYIEPHS